MTRRYFQKFPTIEYNGFNVKDITVSAKLISKYASFPYVYTQFEIDREQRPDQVASEVYDDQNMSWMIWYANQIHDPYYDWFLPEQDFNDFLLKKHGSISYTHRKILGFRTNWYTDHRELEPSEFNNMFGAYKAPHSFYWNPIYDSENRRVLYYVRKTYDNFVNTNKLVKVGVSNNAFEDGTLLNIRQDGVLVGNAEVQAANSTYVFLKNVLGFIGLDYTLEQANSTTNSAEVRAYSADYQATSNTWTRVNINDEEYVYWEPYTLYDMEAEKNEAKKSIRVVDGAMAVRVADRLEDELAGRS